MPAALWVLAAVVLGLGIGRAVRIADQREHAPNGHPSELSTTEGTR